MDAAAPPTPSQLAALASFLGADGPVSVEPIDVPKPGQPLRTASWGVRLSSSPVRDRIVQIDSLPTLFGWPSDHLVAADRFLGDPTDAVLAQRPGLRRLPNRIFDAPAVVFDHRELSTGLRLCAMDASRWPRVAADLGASWRRLGHCEFEWFGTRAGGGRLLPRRASWADTWLATAARAMRMARQAGVDLGPLSDRLLEAVRERADALHGVARFTLVHAGLKPGALLYRFEEGAEGGVALVGLDEWDVAVVGDPLLEWGFLLTTPEEQLAPILHGYGREAIEAELTLDSMARIEAYHLTTCASRIANVAIAVQSSGWSAVLGTLETARRAAERALVPGFAESRIRNALAIAPPHAPAYSEARPWAAERVLRISTGLVRDESGAPPPAVPGLISAVTAGLIAKVYGGRPGNELLAESAVDMASWMVNALGQIPAVESHEPIADRRAWLCALARTMWVSAEKGPGATGLWLVALAAAALDVLDDTLSDGSLRGLEATAYTVATLEQNATVRPPLDAQHGLMAWAATATLISRGLLDVVQHPSSRFEERLRAFATTHQVPTGSTGLSDPMVLQLLVDPSIDDQRRSMRPVWAYAMGLLNGVLDLDPQRLVEALELTG